MNTLITRGNAVFAFGFSAVSALSLACFLSTCLTTYQANVTITPGKIVVKQVAGAAGGVDGPADLAFMKFGLDADFTDVFNWNTKMLFVYLMAEYETSNNALSQVVIWDKKILRGDNAHVQLENMNTKYHFIDDGTGLRGNGNVSLVLQWNVIPNTGSLPVMTGGARSMQIPTAYVR